MNGDLLSDLSYKSIYDAHRNSGAAATIAVAVWNEKNDYGVIELDADGRFANYREKSLVEHFVSRGINVLSERALDLIAKAGHFDMPELILALRKNGERVNCS